MTQEEYGKYLAAHIETVIAWRVCRSLHQSFKGKDPFYTTRHRDFMKHEADADRAMRAAMRKRSRYTGHIMTYSSKDNNSHR